MNGNLIFTPVPGNLGVFYTPSLTMVVCKAESLFFDPDPVFEPAVLFDIDLVFDLDLLFDLDPTQTASRFVQLICGSHGCDQQTVDI